MNTEQRRKKVERRRFQSISVSKEVNIEIDLDELDEDDLVAHLEYNGYTVIKAAKSSMGMGSIKDAELQEAVQEAFEKHGYHLTDILRDLL